MDYSVYLELINEKLLSLHLKEGVCIKLGTSAIKGNNSVIPRRRT